MKCSECSRVAYRALPGGPVLHDAPAALKALPADFATLEQEEFWVLCLNARHRITHRVMVARGSASRCEVQARDVLREALRSGCVAVIVAHNHPSGDPEPSADDRALTRRLAAGCALVGLTLLDHLVVASEGWRSMADDIAAMRPAER